MNIALFSDSYLPTKSGIVTVVIQLKKVLEDLGHHVVVVTVDTNFKIEGSADEQNVYRVKSIPSPVGDNQYIGVPQKRKVIEFLKANNIQLIHAHTEFFMGHIANSAGKELGIPVVATTHTMWEDYYRYYLFMGRLISKGLIRKAVKRLYRKFYAFINVSKKAQDYFRSPFMLPFTPSAIIPNAIDTQKFAGSSYTQDDIDNLKKSLGISLNDKVVLYIGRVVEEKRIKELYDIMADVVKERSDIKMVFVGSGAMEEDLRYYANQAGLEKQIIFTGFVDWTKLYLYYAMCDLFVTASLSEMHSMTILEALCLGKPVVCRKDTSFSDTVFHDVDGYYANSDEEMKKYIIKAVDDPEKLKAMGQAALEISKGFTLKLHGLRTVAFYEEVLKHYPNPVSSGALIKAVANVKLQ